VLRRIRLSTGFAHGTGMANLPAALLIGLAAMAIVPGAEGPKPRPATTPRLIALPAPPPPTVSRSRPATPGQVRSSKTPC